MIVSPDNYRMIDGKYVYDPETEGEVWKKSYSAFYHSLLVADKSAVLLIGPPGSGKSTWLEQHEDPYKVYFDATNTKREERRVLLTLASVLEYPVSGVVFRTPLETCLERNADRSPDRRIPTGIVAQIWLNLANCNPTTREGFSHIVEVD